MRCDGCDVDLIDLQTKMELRALSAGEDWVELPVLASVCPKCGKMDLNMIVPAQFAQAISPSL